ncbi:MAG: DUF4129 domain-containing protein [Caldilineae bacterium]|nr:MAG: DUF4129 domain-containing protein [Caldilineae bacterium]
MTLLLLGFLYLLLAISLDAAGWVQDMSLLIPVVLGGIVMGALMAYSRFDTFFMFSHSLATGLAWVFFWMTRLVGEERRVALFMEHGVPELQARAYFLLERWLAWVQAAINRSASNDNYVFILEISFLLWWLSYLGIWTVLRHGHVWRGVVMAGAALMVNTYYAPNPVTGFLVTFCIFALLLLAWTNLIDHRQRWRALRIYFSQDIAFDFMRMGVLYTIAIITLAFVAPTFGRSALFYRALEPINQRWEATTQEWNRLYQGLNRQRRPVQAAFGRTLTLGGARNVTDKPVFQVEAPRGRYWRAVAFDEFTGRRWINNADTEVRYDAEEIIPTIAWQSRTPLTQTITLFTPLGNVLLAAPDVRMASVPILGLAAPVFAEEEAGAEVVQPSAELTWARARIPLGEGDSYTVISNYTEITERELREASTDYPSAIRERYLQLPEDFSPRVAELAKEVAGEFGNVYDRTKRLETFLRGFEYDDQIEAPGPNQDPVEYFLFDIKRGYCDYYATAMVTMLRSLGIPARPASGYAEGTLDRESGLYIVTERDAHTWVEVYFPGYGWIEFEPTAGESLLNRPSGAEFTQDRIPGMPDDPIQDDQPQFDDSIEGLQNLPEEFGVTDASAVDEGFRPSTQWIVTSVLLTLAALAGGWWLMRRRMYQGPSAFAGDPPYIYYQRLLSWVQRLGLAFQDGLTPYERSERLAEALPGGEPFIARITDIYVRYRYAPRRSVAATQQMDVLDRSWRQLRPILWRAWLDRRLRRPPREDA